VIDTGKHARAASTARVRTATARRSTRRAFLLAAAALPALAWAYVARAQAPTIIRRVGLLSLFTAPETEVWHEALRLGLRDLGWVVGRNINIEYRYAEGKDDRLRDLAADLVGLQVDVIVGSSTPEALAAKNSTRTLPIVMVVPGDPVTSGLVESLARPGGNVTGLSTMSPQLSGKRLELLKEIVPGLARVAVLWDPLAPAAKIQWQEIQVPARQLGVQLHSLEIRSPDAFDKAFEDAIRARVGALVLFAAPVITSNLKRIANFAAKNRLPSIFQYSYFAEAGGLTGYGPDRSDMYRRAATYIDKILKGAKPGELPIEQPTKFELVVNMKTAKALGISIPQSLLLRADKVIE
jgi:putative tryptophan/tyrosine transport system substrate-binding protein